jgi:CheY-like chemotaxis protein
VSTQIRPNERLNVLIAEDNPHHQMLLLRLLSQLGLGADLVEDGVSVLGAIKRKKYGLLLLDLNMPLMSGFEAARTIVKEYPRNQRPLMIAITAITDPGVRARCLEAGISEYLPKPISLDELRSALSAFGFIFDETEKEIGQRTPAPEDSSDLKNRLDVLVSETDFEFVAELVETFVEQGRPAIAEIERALRARDWESLGQNAHSLKGASRNLGAVELAEELQTIESIAEARRGGEQISVEKVKSVFEKSINDLREYAREIARR